MTTYYFAPMEGITGYVHRNAFQHYFPNIDTYFTAFLAPNQKGKLSSREQNDILPEHNEGCHTVPQLLTNKAEDFVRTAEILRDMYGYQEINLNLGCPSKTVVSKYRGAGFLAKPEELDRFLNEIYNKLPDMNISIKTRIGKESPEEFPHLLELYNQYPVKELIIHPRTQQDFYKNHPNWEVFAQGLRESKNPVCYNGDIHTLEDYRMFRARFPEVKTIMLGRGLLMNPGLIELLNEHEKEDYAERTDHTDHAGKGYSGEDIRTRKSRLKAFHDELYQNYREVLVQERTVLFKMKELWFYMIQIFDDNKKYGKKIKKAQHLDGYEAAVEELFAERELLSDIRMQ